MGVITPNQPAHRIAPGVCMHIETTYLIDDPIPTTIVDYAVHCIAELMYCMIKASCVDYLMDMSTREGYTVTHVDNIDIMSHVTVVTVVHVPTT